VALWGLGEDHGLMDSHRAVAPSGALVASMVVLVRGFASVFRSGDGFADRGGGNLLSLRTRRFLWIV
jgi:hypothetical protein